MHLHPGPEKRRVPKAKPAGADPIWRALSENEDWYQDLVEHSHDLLCVHDLKGRLLSVNPAPARLLGYSVEEMLQIPMREMIPPEFWPRFDAYLSQIERTGEARGLLTVMTRSGERRIWEYHNTLRAEGVATPIVRGIAHDVTEQRETEKRMRELSEHLLSRVRENERTIGELKLFRTLVDQSNDAIEVVDPETLRFLDVNEKACSELGYSREELLSLRVFDINPAVTESSVEKTREELRKSGSFVMETVHRRKDGSTFPVEVSLRRVQLERDYVVNVVRNLTERKRVEEALRKSEDKFAKAFRQSPLALTITSIKDHRYIEVNETFESMTGWRREEILGRTPFDIGLWVNPDERLEIANRLLTEGSLRDREASFRMRDGSIRNCLIATEVIELNGEPCAIGVAADITDQKQAEARLREYERAVEGLEEMIVVVDRDYRYVIANRAYLNLRGLEKEQIIGHLASEMVSKQAFETVFKPKLDESFQGKVVRYQASYEYPRLGKRDMFVSYFPIEGPTGVDRIAAVVQDITERKRADERLREYERVVEGLEEIIVVVDRDYRYVIANREFLRRRGLEKEQLVGRTVMDQLGSEGMSKEALALVKEKMDECFQGKVVHYELTYPYPSLGPRDLFLSYFPIEGPTGIDRIACILRDVTERKRTEAGLRKSEEKFSKAFRQSPMALTLSSIQNHHYIDVNETFERLTGWRRDEVIGRTALDIGLWDPADGVDLAKMVLAEGCVRNVEGRYRMRDGSIRIGLSTAELIELNSEPCMLTVTADITERKQGEQTLRESEAYLAEAQRLTHTGSGAWRVAGKDAVYLSEEWHRIYGFDPKEGLAAWEKRLQRIHPEDRDRVEEARDRAIREKSDYEVDHRIVLPDGTVKHTHTVGHPVLNASGDVAQFVYTMMDITERKLGEEALRRSEENYRMFISQSSEGIFRQELDAPVSIDLPEDEMVRHILYDSSMAECNDALARMYGLTSGQEFVGRRLTEMLPPEDPHNIELTRQYIRSGFRVLDRESHEVDIYGAPKVFLNSMIGTVENGMLVRTWGIQRDITEKVKSEVERRKAEETLRQTVTQLCEVTTELRLAKEKLAEEKLYLEEAIDSELGFGEIIGRSSALREVMAKVAKVAPSDATVLLLGETGTGKELVARALHRMSQRDGKSFIKLNCAAIPSGLLESELFGHEKGAFTGAVARKLGRLELADRGTLFLDEIGEIPLSLQPKLLRVLQDLEFERLGGTQTLKVNFRLLAATNRDLLESVRVHEFRSDLYYRLNVFPIYIPPLRERREDIRPLAEHFVRKFAAQMKKSITSIPAKTMETLVRWEWPGNIRELENFMERSVILTPGAVLQSPLSELQSAIDGGNGGSKDKLKDKERERILRVLRDCHGQLGGPDGAAARLGMKRTTLQSRLDHLGIKPAQFRA